jgi:GT2 family glycosyltransferase
VETAIVIVSADEAENLRHSLPLALAESPARVIVVDNASTDDTAAVAHEHGAERIALEARVPYSAALNAGVRAAGGEAVLLLNADCFLEPGFLAAACARLAEPGVGSVAPKLLRTDGPSPDARLDRIDAVGIYMHRSRKNLLAGHDRPLPAFDTPADVFGADGAAALWRREALDACAIDGAIFDEDLESLATDVDLAWRAAVLGWRCAYEPRAVAWHIRTYRPAMRGQIPPRDRRLVFRNRYLLIAKNDRLRELVRDLPWIAAYELAALGFALLREPQLLRGYVEAARLLPAALRRRRAIHACRRPGAAPATRLNALPP